MQGLVTAALATAIYQYVRDPTDVALFAILALSKLTLRPVNVHGKFSVEPTQDPALPGPWYFVSMLFIFPFRAEMNA